MNLKNHEPRSSDRRGQSFGLGNSDSSLNSTRNPDDSRGIRRTRMLKRSLSVVFRLSLFLYPRKLRHWKGDEMTEVFIEQCCDAYINRGVIGLIRVLLITSYDPFDIAYQESREFLHYELILVHARFQELLYRVEELSKYSKLEIQTTQNQESGRTYLTELQAALATYFNLAELRDLCFDTHINYENLPGETLDNKTRELVAYCSRYGLLTMLVKYCQQVRPNVDWLDPGQNPQLVKVFLNTEYTFSQAKNHTPELPSTIPIDPNKDLRVVGKCYQSFLVAVVQPISNQDLRVTARQIVHQLENIFFTPSLQPTMR